jgi:hypothetical protein
MEESLSFIAWRIMALSIRKGWGSRVRELGAEGSKDNRGLADKRGLWSGGGSGMDFRRAADALSRGAWVNAARVANEDAPETAANLRSRDPGR